MPKLFLLLLPCLLHTAGCFSQKAKDTVQVSYFGRDSVEIKFKSWKQYRRSDQLIDYITVKERINDSLYIHSTYDRYYNIKTLQQYADSGLTIRNGLVMEYENNTLLGIGGYRNNVKHSYWVLFDKNTNPKKINFYDTGTKKEIPLPDAFNGSFPWNDFMNEFTDKSAWDSLEQNYPKPIQETIKELHEKIRRMLRDNDIVRVPVHVLAYINDDGMIRLITHLKFTRYSAMEIAHDHSHVFNRGNYSFSDKLLYVLSHISARSLPAEYKGQYYNKFVPIRFLVELNQKHKRIRKKVPASTP